MNLVKKWLLRLVIFIVFVVALVAATDNSQEVALTFLGMQTPTAPLSWWVLAAFLAGVLFGIVINFMTNTRLRMAARKASGIARLSSSARAIAPFMLNKLFDLDARGTTAGRLRVTGQPGRFHEIFSIC